MKKLIIFAIWWAAFVAGSSVYAQKPVAPKTSLPSASGAVRPIPKPIHDDLKREALSRKLIERKNELRSERDHQIHIRNSEAKVKSRESK